MSDNSYLIILPYTAVSFSIIARIIFMYLLYTKKSTNIYSLTFCCLSVLSSSIWIPYGILQNDVPIIVRSGVEILLLSVSGLYILRNRCVQDANKIEGNILLTRRGGPCWFASSFASFRKSTETDRCWVDGGITLTSKN
jgi:hypothetical protein